MSRNTDINQQFTKLIKKLENLEHKNSALSGESQDSFAGTSAIAGGKTNKLRSNGKQRICAERKFENGNSNRRSLNMTNQVQKSWPILPNTDK